MPRYPRTVSGRTDRIVVIGAGLGGLAATLRLVGAGRQVTVLERAGHPGGRAGLVADAGYRFDTGPTVLTMPELIDDALAQVGETLRDRLDLVRLDPAYRANFADGSTIDVHTDPERMAEEITATVSAREADGYRRFVAFLRRLYAVERDSFIDRNLDSPAQLLTPDSVRLLALGGLRRLAPKVGRFLHDDRLRRIFSFQSMYAGLAPHDALAIYAVISYMDTVAGVYFPRGGMPAVPRAMADAATDHGACLRYDTRAVRIEVVGDRARAVHTADGERIPADVVVVNADAPVAYRELLGRTPRRLRRLRYSPSCVVLHAGARRGYEHLAHHNLFFGHAWSSTFAEIIDQGRVMSDPSFLVSNPSRTDPGLAPAGRHTYYVLFPTPNTHAGLDWSALRGAYLEHMRRTVEERGLPGFTDAIEVETATTPDDWAELGLAAGAPFAAAHLFRQSGPFRLPTLDRDVENLVFCRSNTQPGVAVPMVLLSGRIAAERIVAGAA